MAKLDIEVDVKGAKQIDELDKSIKSTEESSSALSKSFAIASKAAGALAIATAAVTAAFVTVAKSGFAYNSEMEDATAGLVALSVATQNDAIPVTLRYAEANKEAAATLSELQEVNKQTPHSLTETTKIYKAMYVSMKAAGATTDDMIEMTRSLSIASGAAGIEFNSLLAGVDGLASGTVLANSDLGRFLSSLGLTNDALKESKDVVGLVTDRLKDFQSQGLMTESVSNFQQSWSSMMGTITESTFEGVKTGLNEIAGSMNSINEDMAPRLREMFNGLAVMGVKSFNAIATAVIKVSQGFNTMGTSLAEIAFRVENGIFLNDEQTASLDRMWAETYRQNVEMQDYITTLDEMEATIVSSIEVEETSIQLKERLTAAQKEYTGSTWKSAISLEELLGIEKQEPAVINKITLSSKELQKQKAAEEKEDREKEKRIKNEIDAYQELDDMMSELILTKDELKFRDLGDDLSKMGASIDSGGLGASNEQMMTYYQESMKQQELGIYATNKNTDALGRTQTSLENASVEVGTNTDYTKYNTESLKSNTESTRRSVSQMGFLGTSMGSLSQSNFIDPNYRRAPGETGFSGATGGGVGTGQSSDGAYYGTGSKGSSYRTNWNTGGTFGISAQARAEYAAEQAKKVIAPIKEPVSMPTSTRPSNPTVSTWTKSNIPMDNALGEKMVTLFNSMVDHLREINKTTKLALGLDRDRNNILMDTYQVRSR